MAFQLNWLEDVDSDLVKDFDIDQWIAHIEESTGYSSSNTLAATKMKHSDRTSNQIALAERRRISQPIANGPWIQHNCEKLQQINQQPGNEGDQSEMRQSNQWHSLLKMRPSKRKHSELEKEIEYHSPSRRRKMARYL